MLLLLLRRAQIDNRGRVRQLGGGRGAAVRAAVSVRGCGRLAADRN